MRQCYKKIYSCFQHVYERRALYFWPLIVAGGRLAVRMVLNIWDMLEK